jgi:mono/diheme cytochrome c family protein
MAWTTRHPRSRPSTAVALSTIALLACGFAAPCTSHALADYITDVKPLLQARCIGCHGALHKEAGLRLDAASLIMGGGDSGTAIVPGDADASLLIERVSAPTRPNACRRPTAG